MPPKTHQLTSQNQLSSQNMCLARYPKGLPRADDFTMTQTQPAEPKAGQITVKNQFLSVDPYMRGRMTGITTYAPPYELGEPMSGGAAGIVLKSAHPDFKKGDWVTSLYGWREAYTQTVEYSPVTAMEKIDPNAFAPEHYLGIAGMPGLTAYVGLYEIAGYQRGETVLVSGAAGAVGSTVCQLVKADGGKVIALAGSDSKCKWLESRGVDIAINYKKAAQTSGGLSKIIKNACPDGVHIYFENVGGDMLEAALNNLQPHGRIAACGMIGQYNSTVQNIAPSNLIQIVGKSLKIQGFIVYNYQQFMPDYRAKLAPLLATGQIEANITYADGLDQAVPAFLRLFSGEKTGKMIIRL